MLAGKSTSWAWVLRKAHRRRRSERPAAGPRARDVPLESSETCRRFALD